MVSENTLARPRFDKFFTRRHRQLQQNLRDIFSFSDGLWTLRARAAKAECYSYFHPRTVEAIGSEMSNLL